MYLIVKHAAITIGGVFSGLKDDCNPNSPQIIPASASGKPSTDTTFTNHGI